MGGCGGCVGPRVGRGGLVIPALVGNTKRPEVDCPIINPVQPGQVVLENPERVRG